MLEPGLIGEESVAELGILTMGVEQRVGAVGLDQVGVGDGLVEPPGRRAGGPA
jgi:hypothetical protein